MPPLLFLDIDGVLNSHVRPPGSPYCTIRPENVAAFNLVLKQAEPHIVLSSAWRYIVHGSAMTLSGFGYMLHTHGVIGISNRIIGLTCRDEHCAHCGHKAGRREKRRVTAEGYFLCRDCGKHSTRGDQITHYLRHHGRDPLCHYAVVDDCDFGIRDAGHPFVQTDQAKGLTVHKARLLVRALLKGSEVRSCR